MSVATIDKWNAIHSNAKEQAAQPHWFDSRIPSLSVGHQALDVASGRGGASLVMARRGFSVTAADISQVGLASLAERASTEELSIRCHQIDLEKHSAELSPSGDFVGYAMIHCAHYLDYSLFEKLSEWLLPQGCFLTEHHGRKNLERSPRPSARYLVDEAPMNAALSSLTLLYREDAWHQDRYLCRRVWQK